ncbi:MAG: LLM class flavin-dependent oxidoreductase [Polyangiales bacterium]
MELPLSLLDLFPVAAGISPSRAIHDGARLAQRAEELGYVRYWVAEHHNMPNIATSAPEVIIEHVASATKTIRVGAGGIMVPNHSPLHVVEVFRTLEALHPGRIDLGLGRAPGTDPVASSALRRGRTEVNEQLAEILAFGRGDFPEGHPYRGVVAMPSDVPLPPVFMLGSTDAGAAIGAALGVRYAFAGHFAMAGAIEAIEIYKKRFRPSADLEKPYAILAATVVCGEDDAHADWLAGPLRRGVVGIRTGKREPFLSFEEAAKRPLNDHERALVEDFLHGAIIGGPEKVQRGLRALAAETHADEIMVSTLIPSAEERIRSYERVMLGK